LQLIHRSKRGCTFEGRYATVKVNLDILYWIVFTFGIPPSSPCQQKEQKVTIINSGHQNSFQNEFQYWIGYKIVPVHYFKILFIYLGKYETKRGNPTYNPTCFL
jgi:hypothetical protein